MQRCTYVAHGKFPKELLNLRKFLQLQNNQIADSCNIVEIMQS